MSRLFATRPFDAPAPGPAGGVGGDQGLGGRAVRGDRGVVAVEAALAIPVLILLFLSMVDFGMLLRDHVAATTLARAGARVASAEPRFGTNLPSDAWGHKGVGLTSSFAQDAADAMERSGSALPRSAIDDIWVYLANPKGYPSQSLANWASDTTSTFSNCPPASCVVYRWNNGSPGRFSWVSGTWDPRQINSCQGTSGMQSVGVYLKAHHDWLFRVFPGTSANVTARTVMKFEPRSPTDPSDPNDLPTATKPGSFAGCKP